MKNIGKREETGSSGARVCRFLNLKKVNEGEMCYIAATFQGERILSELKEKFDMLQEHHFLLLK